MQHTLFNANLRKCTNACWQCSHTVSLQTRNEVIMIHVINLIHTLWQFVEVFKIPKWGHFRCLGFFPLHSAIRISQMEDQTLENPGRNCLLTFQTSVLLFFFCFFFSPPFLTEVEEPTQLVSVRKCCPSLARRESSLIKSDIPESLQLERIKVQREQPEEILLQRRQRLLIITMRQEK